MATGEKSGNGTKTNGLTTNRNFKATAALFRGLEKDKAEKKMGGEGGGDFWPTEGLREPMSNRGREGGEQKRKENFFILISERRRGEVLEGVNGTISVVVAWGPMTQKKERICRVMQEVRGERRLEKKKICTPHTN